MHAFSAPIVDYVPANGRARVLLAHADQRQRRLHAASLRMSGYAVLAISDGDEAMNVLASISDGDLAKPDHAMLDVNLPIYVALRVLQAVRRTSPEIPVIILSPRLNATLRALIEQFDVFACITKPVSSAVLLRALEAASNDLHEDRETTT